MSNNTPKRDQLLNVQGAFANELIGLTNSAAKQVDFSCSNSVVNGVWIAANRGAEGFFLFFCEVELSMIFDC